MRRPTPASLPSLLLCFMPLVLLPVAAAASDLSGLRRQAEGCLASRDGLACQSLLDASQQLKKAAEKRDQLRCYTSLLAVEAVLIDANVGGGNPTEIDQAFDEASRTCEAL